MRGPTTDHGEILLWASRNDAVPAEIRRLKFDGEPSILYFLFGKERVGTEELRPIQWEDFFARFELMGLSLVYDDDRPWFELLQVQPELGQQGGLQ